MRNDFRISFEVKNIDHCYVYSENNTSKIYYNPNNFSNASIAHELLHIKLRRFNFVRNHIYLSCKNHKKLRLIFTKQLCDHISNCFDHVKMYPEYLQLGYSPDDFLRNALEEKSTIKIIKSIKMKFLLGYKAISLDPYIGNSISIYADHADNQYDEHLNLLEQKSPELFEIISKLWNNWIHFDITKIDTIYNSDIELFERFIGDMEEWVKNKIIV